jgi:hypothetical protein
MNEDQDKPIFGYSHDFIAILSIWIVGIVLGVAGTILFLLV